MSNRETLQALLDEKADFYERQGFIDTDPICIPHRYSNQEDIEIAGFLTATIAWGQRKTIINNAHKLMAWMDDAPADFIRNFKDADLKPFANFVHRTFNGDDCLYFLHALQHIYREQGGLRTVMTQSPEDRATGLSRFKESFFNWEHLPRTRKHVSDPLRGSSAKRLNMYLRWMVRPAKQGVDFGLWTELQPRHLCMPLDVHTATVARSLGLLSRKQNDWRAVQELTEALRAFDPDDPVRYDFALFGMGAFEKIV